jgi:hypothetical protein
VSFAASVLSPLRGLLCPASDPRLTPRALFFEPLRGSGSRLVFYFSRDRWVAAQPRASAPPCDLKAKRVPEGTRSQKSRCEKTKRELPQPVPSPLRR